VSSQNHALIWDYDSTTVRLCTVKLVLVAMFGIVSDIS